MPRIAIVGAGFSGTALACRLLNTAQDSALELLLINRDAQFGRGLAYGCSSERLLLNVPAGRLSLSEDDPDAFLRYAQRRVPDASSASFLPRRLFGEYLAASLARAARRATGRQGPRLNCIVGEAVGLQQDAHGLRLELADGRHVEADRVVLATGHNPPANPLPAGVIETLGDHPGYIPNAWAPDTVHQLRQRQPSSPTANPILLLGTGLTMLDTLLSLREAGASGPILALSRRGLLPQPHRRREFPPTLGTLLPSRLLRETRALPMLRLLRAEIAGLTANGGDWRDVINALRSSTPQLWRQLPLLERSRFLRHLRPWWDSHRHRAAPETIQQLDLQRRSGQLAVGAGRLLQVQADGTQLSVSYRPRRSTAVVTLTVSALVNCSGPVGDPAATRDPLLRQLLSDGLLRADPLRLGIDVAGDYRPLDSAGRPAERLYYLGPWLQARDWEATAVPELRRHAVQVARSVLASLVLDVPNNQLLIHKST